MKKEDIERLAALSRIEISDEEKKGLLEDLKSILGYVGEIRELADAEPPHAAGELRNVMRDDVPYKRPLATSEELLAGAPEREGDYIKVDQVL
ncbi:MAG: Asp-tRNA(Asn)/Glu-tRNA(Gln) amidotransferase subunit GatC [bacterium]|nr:Asp-tRNA(Asn)/Glu-tRNA(Gln) amidotransferase subunit GatC [bacterium]